MMMIIIVILRWLFGYIEFEIHGKFPERFLNLVNKKGIVLWQLKSIENGICAKTKSSNFEDLQNICKKTQNEIHIIHKKGLPVLVETYKYRLGLLVGAVLFFSLCKYLSGFIWNININVPNNINEYSIRNELRELGIYEGIRNNNLDIHKIERTITINNPEISWITINIMGTTADVIITPNLSMNINKAENIKASNLKSSNDGTITRMEVKNGTSMVKVGDGVTKNQLLVSGVIEYNDASSSLVDSNAQIYAMVSKKIEIVVPLDLKLIKKDEIFIQKNDINILGITIPLSLNQNPSNNYIKNVSSNDISLFNNKIPVTINSENWYKYMYIDDNITTKQAKKIAYNRAKLYEFFLLYSSNKGKFLNKKYSVREDSDKIILSVNYNIEEDICEKSIIELKED